MKGGRGRVSETAAGTDGSTGWSALRGVAPLRSGRRGPKDSRDLRDESVALALGEVLRGFWGGRCCGAQARVPGRQGDSALLFCPVFLGLLGFDYGGRFGNVGTISEATFRQHTIMADMKFSCPHCQQHISADSGYAGAQINCPSCNGSLMVPGDPAAVEVESAPAPVPAPPPVPARYAIRSTGAAAPAAPAAEAPAAATGSGCPSCGVALPRGAVLCTNCGYNLATRQRMVAGRPAPMGRPQAQADGERWYLTPWPYLGVVVLLVGIFYLLGRQNPAFYLGIAAVLGVYWLATTVILLVAAFKESVATGLLTLCLPFYAFYFVFKVNDNDTLKILYGFNIVIFVSLKFIGAFMK